MHHCVQRQPLYWATKPPTIGLAQSVSTFDSQIVSRPTTHPSEGPANGAIRNMLVAMARTRGGNKSAFVPAPTASAGLPDRPAKNRHTHTLAKLFESPTPSVKSINIGLDVRYTSFRPWPSLNGAVTTGPKARPNVKKVRPRIALVRDI